MAEIILGYCFKEGTLTEEHKKELTKKGFRFFDVLDGYDLFGKIQIDAETDGASVHEITQDVNERLQIYNEFEKITKINMNPQLWLINYS